MNYKSSKFNKKIVKPKILHLGCGPNKKPYSIGVDFNKNVHPDIVHNLDKFPYPFKDNQFNTVIAQNIVEHIENIPKFMEEIHRICTNGAKILITTGHFSGIDAFTDPTHKHFFTSRTFDYFIPKTDLYELQYSKAQFKKNRIVLGPQNSKNFMLRFILAIINKHQVIYEKRFAFIFPVGVISYELAVVKNRTI